MHAVRQQAGAAGWCSEYKVTAFCAHSAPCMARRECTRGCTGNGQFLSCRRRLSLHEPIPSLSLRHTVHTHFPPHRRRRGRGDGQIVEEAGHAVRCGNATQRERETKPTLLARGASISSINSGVGMVVHVRHVEWRGVRVIEAQQTPRLRHKGLDPKSHSLHDLSKRAVGPCRAAAVAAVQT